jgi:2'-5' RNA ligase
MTPPDAAEPASPRHVRADWNQYRNLSRLVDHWDRPGWRDGRRSYHWIVTFAHVPGVTQLAVRCQDQLRRQPTLDLVAVDSLHVTIQRVAFTDEMTPSILRTVAVAATNRYAALPPFTATVGPLAGSTGAVRFSVGPHQPFHRVRDAARAAIAEVAGPAAVPDATAPFVPHVSIAYNNSPTDARPIIDTVAHLRTYGSVTAPIRIVDLVELRREGKAYVWAHIAAAPLTGQDG